MRPSRRLMVGPGSRRRRCSRPIPRLPSSVVQTVTDALDERIERQRGLLRELILDQPGELRDINKPSSSVVFVGPSHAWPDLDDLGRQLQSRLLDDHRKLGSLLEVLFAGSPADTLREFTEKRTALEELIDQSHLSWFETRAEAWAQADKALTSWRTLLGRLYDPSHAEVLYVPDTNALLWNPNLEDWQYPNVSNFGLVLTATVLRELDRLKTEHRNQDVRQKAEGLVSRIKGYRARGDLGAGVPLHRGRSTLRTIATEPDFNDTLPWLDPTNDDDRILASFIEVMRAHPRTAVVLITRDINLQNKVEYASLPFSEPPERSQM
jgi:hypothetical protein